MASYFKVSEKRSSVLVVIVHFLLTMSSFFPLKGQETLNLVDSLAATGEVERARSILQAWWETDLLDADRHDRQYSLWLRAILTVDPGLASLDFHRLVLSFPGGPYSDDALSRLALISVARGDLLRAQEYFQNIVLDYPGSPKRRNAERWLEGNQGLLEELELEMRSPSREGGPPTSQEGGELPSQTSGVMSESYAVQVGAFSSRRRAKDLATIISEKGFEARVVGIQGSPLMRVRIGKYLEREGASILVQKLVEIGQTATVVDDVLLEVSDP